MSRLISLTEDPRVDAGARSLLQNAAGLVEAVDAYDGPEARRLLEDIEGLVANLKFLLDPEETS